MTSIESVDEILLRVGTPEIGLSEQENSRFNALPRIAGFGSAVPSAITQKELWEDSASDHFGGHRFAQRVFSTSGIETRHMAADPRAENVVSWTTGERMRRYLDEALPLGNAAASEALHAAGVRADEIGLFTVVSCTGYVTPGVDILLSKDMGMSPTVRRMVVGHMGCYASVPGLGVVTEYVASRGMPALLLCVELCSLHTQPPSASFTGGSPSEDDLEQVVAHALFADAATAIVITPGDSPNLGEPGLSPDLRVVDVVAMTDTSTTDLMSWTVTDHGFRMRLSAKVPLVLGRHVNSVVGDLLAKNGLTFDDVDGWAVHPGGVRILQAVETGLGLADGDLASAYHVLSEHGNCSSATLPLVLRRLVNTQEIRPGKAVVALAFGPGLTIFATLLQRPGLR